MSVTKIDRTIGNDSYSTGTIAVDATGLIITLSSGSFGTTWGDGDKIEIDTGGTPEYRFVKSRDSSTQLTLYVASIKTSQSGLGYNLTRSHGNPTTWVADRNGDFTNRHKGTFADASIFSVGDALYGQTSTTIGFVVEIENNTVTFDVLDGSSFSISETIEVCRSYPINTQDTGFNLGSGTTTTKAYIDDNTLVTTLDWFNNTKRLEVRPIATVGTDGGGDFITHTTPITDQQQYDEYVIKNWNFVDFTDAESISFVGSGATGNFAALFRETLFIRNISGTPAVDDIVQGTAGKVSIDSIGTVQLSTTTFSSAIFTDGVEERGVVKTNLVETTDYDDVQEIGGSVGLSTSHHWTLTGAITNKALPGELITFDHGAVSLFGIIKNTNKFTIIENLGCKNWKASVPAIKTSGDTGGTIIRKNVLHDTAEGQYYWTPTAIALSDNDVQCNDNLILRISNKHTAGSSYSYKGIGISSYGGNRIYNNTVINCSTTCLNDTAASVSSVNNIYMQDTAWTYYSNASGTAVCTLGNSTTGSNNMDSDGTLLSSYNNQRNKDITKQFIDYLINNFLLVKSSNAIRKGLGPDTDANVSTSDILGNTRRGLKSDIGFHQLSKGGLIPILKKRINA